MIDAFVADAAVGGSVVPILVFRPTASAGEDRRAQNVEGVASRSGLRQRGRESIEAVSRALISVQVSLCASRAIRQPVSGTLSGVRHDLKGNRDAPGTEIADLRDVLPSRGRQNELDETRAMSAQDHG
jgi:hypothetical protein